jgi:Outer membrane protein beta-barrel domain
MYHTRHLALAALLVLAASATAAAQPTQAAYPPGHGTTLNGFGGVATASSEPGALFGGAVGWEITPWFGIEGNASWLDRPAGEEGFTAAASALVNLTGRQTVVPFVKGGFGLYRASFADADHVTPEFYRQRLGEGGSSLATPQAFTDPSGTRQTFTDPAFVAGGGLNLFLSRHVALRPQIEAIIVTRDSRSHVVTAFTLHLAYHFEEHPITPSSPIR